MHISSFYVAYNWIFSDQQFWYSAELNNQLQLTKFEYKTYVAPQEQRTKLILLISM